MTIREVNFEEWQWEEELTVFTLEEVGIGIYKGFCQIFLNTFFAALIINLVGLGISTIIFVIEIILYKTNKR